MAKVLIVGAGSIGVYLGTRLYAKKHDVSLLGRTKLKQLHDTILINEEPFNLPRRIYQLSTQKDFDYVFITSKLYDLKKNLKLLKKNGIRAACLVSIQNGLVDEKLYKPYLQGAQFTSISVFEGFRIVENQLRVSATKLGWITEDSPAGRKVAKLLQDAGIRCTTSQNLDAVKAEKTIMNCSVNVLSAIEKKTFFELFRNAKLGKRIRELFDESYDVLSALTRLPEREELWQRFHKNISQMKHYSSTYQDAITGKKTEIEFLNKYIVQLGKKTGISTPKNSAIMNDFQRIYKPH